MKNKYDAHKIKERTKKRYALGTGGGPPLSPTHEIDGDDLEALLDENVLAEPIVKSDVVMRKKDEGGSTNNDRI